MRLVQDRDQLRALVNSHEPSGSIKGEGFVDQLSDYLPLKKDSVLRS